MPTRIHFTVMPKYAPSRCAWRAERGTIRFRTATGSDETDFVQKPSADEREPYIHTASEETAVVNKRIENGRKPQVFNLDLYKT